MSKLYRYRNPWAKLTGVPGPEFYENEGRQVFEHRGVIVIELNTGRLDFILADTCIAQRRSTAKNKRAREIAMSHAIDELLDGKSPAVETVVAHIKAHGGQAITYEQYSESLK